ncbi:MAG: hypothetical protein WCK00_15510 [Deltaproteobacteria bacterium]
MQQHGDRRLIHNPPPPPLSTAELDKISDLEFAGDAHPYYKIGDGILHSWPDITSPAGSS